MKKIISWSFILVMLATLLMITLSAPALASGYGSNSSFLLPIDPPNENSIPISNGEELRKIGTDKDYPLHGKYHLTADIDLSDGAWKPIGDIYKRFTGIFDGQGHIIRNLTIISGNNYSLSGYVVGLFGAAFEGLSKTQTGEGVIKNVGLEGTNININIIDSFFDPKIYVGGICADGGYISNCYNTGTISVTANGNSSDGGINIGGISGSNSTINDCYNTGVISSKGIAHQRGTRGFSHAGGICGYKGIISNSYNTGAVLSSYSGEATHSIINFDAYAGGICGFNDSGGSISNCYNTGDLSAFIDSPVMSVSPSHGRLRLYAGGICGYSKDNATVKNSFWNIDSKQTLDGDNLSNADKKGLGYGVGQATGLTDEQMKEQASFSGWDFSTVWTIKPGENNGYPVLRVFYPETPPLAPLPVQPTTSTDKPSSWAEGDVAKAIAANLVPQHLQSKYTQTTTRAEFCALAVALYETVKGAEINDRMAFNDSDDVSVQKMGALGVVTGVGNGNFAPNNNLTREQAATMLARLAEAIGRPLPKQAATFTDNSSISAWALEGAGQVQAVGVMSGTGNNMFSPMNPYTREQSIITILRLYNVVK